MANRKRVTVAHGDGIGPEIMRATLGVLEAAGVPLDFDVVEIGEAAYRIHFDDYVADPTLLRGLFDWLGEDFDEVVVRETFAVQHSS